MKPHKIALKYLLVASIGVSAVTHATTPMKIHPCRDPSDAELCYILCLVSTPQRTAQECSSLCSSAHCL